MISYTEAMSIFNKSFQKLTITKCIDYDELHFIIEAIDDPNSTNYNDPYYAVNKKSGDITGFIPSLDLETFFEAVDNRTVYSL